jgi:hypothetical protein
VQDLSPTGCSIRSPYQPQPGASLELRLYLPDTEWPLAVHHAEVTWSHWDCFTVEFRDGQASSLLATYLEHWESEPA